MVYEFASDLLKFFERGGLILWFILLLSMLMWTLLLERYWYLQITHPRKLKALESTGRHDTLPGRLALAGQLESHLPMIRSLVYVLPLLGLLGTVAGMIQTFDVLTLFGNSNPRGLSAGISQALLSTMAGLVTSLSGLYFISHLSQRVATTTRTLIREDELEQPLSLTPLLGLRQRLLNIPQRRQDME